MADDDLENKGDVIKWRKMTPFVAPVPEPKATVTEDPDRVAIGQLEETHWGINASLWLATNPNSLSRYQFMDRINEKSPWLLKMESRAKARWDALPWYKKLYEKARQKWWNVKDYFSNLWDALLGRRNDSDY